MRPERYMTYQIIVYLLWWQRIRFVVGTLVCLDDFSNCIDNSSWWRHQMETFSALLAICAGNSPVPGEFPTQRPVTRSFDVYFDLRPNKWLSKQSWGWWFETLSCSLWRHRNGCTIIGWRTRSNNRERITQLKTELIIACYPSILFYLFYERHILKVNECALRWY